MSTVDLAVTLRRAALRAYPEYDLDSAEATATLAEEVDAAYADLEEECVLPGRALVLLWRTSSPFLDDAQRARVEVAPGDVDAVHWVAKRLTELAPRLDASLELSLDAAHRPLLPRLAEARLVPRMTFLTGPPQRALEGLRAGGLDQRALGELTLVRMRPDEHIEPVVTLLRDIFRERPELGMLPAALALSPATQDRIDTFSRQTLGASADNEAAFVVLHGDEVVGQGSVHVRRDPLVGLVGGVSLALRSDVQGRGVGKLVYEKLLERMVALEVRVMRGRTANGAVLHLAERMGRSVRGWQVELSPRAGGAS